MANKKVSLIEGNANLKELSWIAFYNDGNKLSKFNDDGSENRYEDIDRGRLVRFSLCDNETPVFTIHLTSGQSLIYRKRVWARVDGTVWHFIYIVGWRQKIYNQKGQVRELAYIAYVNPTGVVEISNDINDIQLVKCEVLK